MWYLYIGIIIATWYMIFAPRHKNCDWRHLSVLYVLMILGWLPFLFVVSTVALLVICEKLKDERNQK